MLQLSRAQAAADANAAGFTSVDYEQLLPWSMEQCPHGFVEGAALTRLYCKAGGWPDGVPWHRLRRSSRLLLASSVFVGC